MSAKTRPAEISCTVFLPVTGNESSGLAVWIQTTTDHSSSDPPEEQREKEGHDRSLAPKKKKGQDLFYTHTETRRDNNIVASVQQGRSHSYDVVALNCCRQGFCSVQHGRIFLQSSRMNTQNLWKIRCCCTQLF